MEYSRTENTVVNDGQSSPRFLIIGSGPVGVRFANEILKRNAKASVTLIGEEKYVPYNRVQLSSLLAGDVAQQDIELNLPGAEFGDFEFVQGRVVEIDTDARHVCLSDKTVIAFDKLVIATGARPHVPNIDGVEQTGVYTFRNLRDAEALYARTSRSQQVIVVGGGLLGIESAKALLKNNTNVTLVQQGETLMNKQLDATAAKLVREKVEELGIRVITNTSVRKVLGKGRVTGVLLRSKEEIDCDTVLFCSGITPNMELARDAGIKVNRAILVDNQLQTSESGIYAIGECCEHEGQTFGVVNPGYEQAAVLADVLSGGEAQYLGSQQSCRLKVMAEPVRSIGEVVNYVKTPFDREWQFQKESVYRKLIIQKGIIAGAVLVGESPEATRILEAYQQRRKLKFWQPWLFKFTGRLWPTEEAANVSQWSAQSIVCQCNHISKGELSEVIAAGCKSVKELSDKTGAGSVCGTCKPLLKDLVCEQGGSANAAEPEKEWGWAITLVASFTAIAIALTILSVPGLAVGESVTTPAVGQFLWDDKFWKQVTGFSLLGLSAIGLMMSLRKRLGWNWLGKFAYWRVFHIALGVTCAVTLLAHTGLHTGDNLNQLLLFNFLMILIMGALAGVAVSLSHRLQPQRSVAVKRALNWAHIIVSWPLPVLIGMHILTVYYF